MLSHVILFTALCFLLIGQLGVMQESRHCPSIPSEFLRILSQSLPTIKRDEQFNDSKMGISEKLTHQSFVIYNLARRLKLLERRLKSVEQPNWTIREGSNSSWSECEKGPCQCNRTSYILYCIGRNLKSLPVHQIVPATIGKLDLSQNSLAALNRDSFRGLRNLSELLITENRLEHISQDLFHGLINLSSVKLCSNKIEHLHSRTFASTRNLKIIDVKDNLLENIHDNILSSLEDVVTVDFSSNKLRNLPVNLLRNTTKLEDFNVSRNKVKDLKVGLFSHLPYLKKLGLSDNEISNNIMCIMWNEICKDYGFLAVFLDQAVNDLTLKYKSKVQLNLSFFMTLLET